MICCTENNVRDYNTCVLRRSMTNPFTIIIHDLGNIWFSFIYEYNQHWSVIDDIDEHFVNKYPLWDLFYALLSVI